MENVGNGLFDFAFFDNSSAELLVFGLVHVQRAAMGCSILVRMSGCRVPHLLMCIQNHILLDSFN